MNAVAKSVANAISWDEEILQSARAFAVKLRARTKEIDRLASIPQDLAEEAMRAGFYDMMRPRALSGRPVSSLRIVMEVIWEIAKGDAGAAWAIALVGASNNSIAALFPKETIDEFYATPGGPRAAGTHAWRSCKIRQVDGGIVVEHGLWAFNSGVNQANWDVLGVPVLNEAGVVVGAGAALFPISDVKILGDWDTIGLRGSGSSSVEVTDVFVPHRRLASFAQGSSQMSKPALEKSDDSWLGAVPLALTFGNIFFASVALGAADAALELFLASVDKRGITYTHYEKLGDSSPIHVLVAECKVRLNLARGVLTERILVFETAARTGTDLPSDAIIRMRGEVAYATRMIWEAVDGLSSACGGSFAANGNAISRQWRDVKVVNMHGMAAPMVNLELYGRFLCGRPPHMKML